MVLLLITTTTVTFSGCIEETEVIPEPESPHNDTTKYISGKPDPITQNRKWA